MRLFSSHKGFLFAAAALAATFSCTSHRDKAVRTDPLDDALWEKSQWISVADAPVITDTVYDGSRAADGASWFVTTIQNDNNIKSAKWMTTGLGVYELYANGKLVGDEILKPGFTHFAKTRLSFTYDIAPLLKKGENIIAAQVTPGWWADKIITPGENVGMIGKKCAFRSVLEITWADGSKSVYGTDTKNWKAGIAGPVKHAAIFDGEEYDARELPGYDTPEKLSTPETNDEFQGKIFPSDGAEVYLREDIALAPVKAYTWKNAENVSDTAFGRIIVKKEFQVGKEELTVEAGDTLVIDFGQNCAAVPSFVFKAAEGTEMTCLPAEILNDGNGAKSRGMDGPEGSCHRTNLRIPEEGMILKYTFAAGDDYVSFTPRCTFFGYRYVSITATGDLNIKKIRSVPVTSISKDMETGTITTGNDLVNKLISNTIWGQRSNYLSVTTDCPQRNERLGWTADTQVFTETGTFFANTLRFFHKWMRDMRDSQSEKGGFPGVAPTAQYGAEETSMMRLGWADAGIIVPWTVWKQFGDNTIIDENWEAMERFIDHINETKYDHKALKAENGNYQWADWLSYEPLENCSGGSWGKDGNPLPDTYDYWNYLSASYWMIDAGMMRDMAAATGRDTTKYDRMVDDAKEYLTSTFFDKDGRFKTSILNTMQTPVLFALKNGLINDAVKKEIIDGLRENFAAHDDCLQTGFLGTSILMKTLTDNGMSDIAYELLLQRKNPSWLYSVDNGATTIWERWNSYTIENGMGPAGMNSFNHYAYGCVCQWLWETAAGIAADPSNPGFKHIIMAPIPDKRLGYLKAEYHSPAGVIKSEWEYNALGVWIWHFTIPEGATASVFIPGKTVGKEYPAGSHIIEM